jgi:hypothetical protein
VAFVLNLAFGYDPTGAFGQQACSPELAPGRLLNTLKVSQLDQLLLGDLVYITLGAWRGVVGWWRSAWHAHVHGCWQRL